jgi:hypothetical protein
MLTIPARARDDVAALELINIGEPIAPIPPLLLLSVMSLPSKWVAVAPCPAGLTSEPVAAIETSP